jgi:hypothetical protein
MKREDYFNPNQQATPSDPMAADLVVPRGSKGGRIENSPFRRIPAITKFIVKPGEYNHLLAGSGLERKLKAEVEFELEKVQNKMNKRLAKEIRRLKNALKNGKTDFYWERAEFLMKNSAALRLSAMNSVFNGWYKNRPIQNVIDIAFKVENILRNNIADLRYFRVEIPKGSPEEIFEWFAKNPDKAWPGKMRPLGVPTASWRVVLHMWNGFLTMFLENELKEFNHAYMPRVGTNTAIKDLVLKVLDRKFIYEFDIQGFFNNVSLIGTVKALLARGMPKKQVEDLFKIAIAAPLNLDWADDKPKSSYDAELSLRRGIITSDEASLAIRKMPHRTSVIVPYLAEWGFSEGDTESMLRGLPQGAAPSTILSLLALSDWHKALKDKGIKLLMYADDGILYSDQPFEPTPPPGFKFAPDKSRWVRKDNEQVEEELKFLGVKYDFKKGLLKGATRNGSTLEFGKNQKDVFEKLKELVPSGHSCAEMPALVRSSIFGLALSKLYGGKFGKIQYEEKQTFDASSYWGKYHDIESLKKSKMEQRLASTIACGWLKIIIKHTMGKSTRSKMHQEVREYHKEEKIDWSDLASAFDWEEIWNRGGD